VHIFCSLFILLTAANVLLAFCGCYSFLNYNLDQIPRPILLSLSSGHMVLPDLSISHTRCDRIMLTGGWRIVVRGQLHLVLQDGLNKQHPFRSGQSMFPCHISFVSLCINTL
jgi:hypothetical protein